MTPPRNGLQHLSRRGLLKGFGLAPLLLRPSPLAGAWLSAATSPAVPLPFAGHRFQPSYPARSPLEDVLRRVRPGSDEFITEGYAYELEGILERWSADLKRRNFSTLR